MSQGTPTIWQCLLPLAIAALPASCMTDFDVGHLRRGDGGDADGAPHADATSTQGPDQGAGCASCAVGETCCGTSCIDLHTSSRHCGACGASCPGTLCLSGQCSGQCQLGRLDCDDNVVNGCEADAATDPHNCGACGRSCRADQTCVIGACGCVAGKGDCDGLTSTGCEAEFDSDPRNCGGCGRACAAGQACVSGVCACAPGFADCDSIPSNGCEVESRTDGANCGVCGHACGPNASCADSTCRCNAGFLSCGAAFACTTPATDPDNCGACGVRCIARTPVCGAAGCSVACAGDEMRCGASCVDTASDVNNCGGCGTVCAAPSGAPAGSTVATCGTHGCSFACSPGFADCDGRSRNGCEVDTRTSHDSCGSCSHACGASQFCASGVCACALGLRDCGGGVCAGCCRNADCSDGSACTDDTCNGGACAHASACTSGRRCCGATVGCNACCSDDDCTSTAGHKGCGPDGTCSVCAAGFRDCDGLASTGCEASLATDPANCGACGAGCTFANAAAACGAGTCRLGTCLPGFGNCDGTPLNGCETRLASSVSNCGACGVACTAVGTVCVGGACVVGSACPAGTGDCDHVASNGCEHDVTADLANCGACGSACSLTNAAAVCTTGACQIRACNTGFADCDGLSTNGCEVNLQSSASHCGTCAVACSLPHAAAACVSGTCGVGSCNPGYGDCDGSAANGCETDLRTSANHCGACGVACPAGANATPVCSNSQCAYDCAPGHIDCDGNATPGCEVDNGSDVTHCGLCATACGATMNAASGCSGGSCGFTCSPAFLNCDGDPANGCEVAGGSDVNHCGACGVACRAYPQSAATCAAGLCGFTCEPGWADCDGSPVNGCERDTDVDARHCGGCGQACAGSTPRCWGGTCVVACPAGTSECSGDCVDLTADRNSCGTCGHRCASDQTCVAASCARIAACSPPAIPCDGVCVNAQSDPSNCGACGRTCPLGQVCTAGSCGVPGDTCARPLLVDLQGGPGTFQVDTTGATDSAGSCRGATPDVFIAFTLVRQELVYADSFGTRSGGPRAQLALLDGCMAGSVACAMDSCNGGRGGAGQAQVYRVMGAGAHLLEVDTSSPGIVGISLQHVPLETLGASDCLPLAASFRLSDTTALRSHTPGTCGLGPDLAYYWVTCPAAPAGTLNATTCGGATWDTALQLVNGTFTSGGCNDNVFACAPQSTLAATVSAGAGIHVLFVDGASSSARGTFVVTGTRP